LFHELYLSEVIPRQAECSKSHQKGPLNTAGKDVQPTRHWHYRDGVKTAMLLPSGVWQKG